MKKYILILCITLLFSTIVFLLVAHKALADDYKSVSNIVNTQVGSPSTSAPADTGSALAWNEKINAALTPGLWGFYNRLETNISNGTYTATQREGLYQYQYDSTGLYWCTYAIVDAYNLAGRPGLTISGDGGVVQMAIDWRSLPGFTYVEYQQADHLAALSKVKPGYAIFFEAVRDTPTSDGEEHVAMVTNISVNSHGDGSLSTIDANGPGRSTTYTIVDGDILNTIHPTIGFGG